MAKHNSYRYVCENGMVTGRQYGLFARQDAACIAAEVINTGKSTNWYGSIEAREGIAKILRNFHILYVDDLSGTWKFVRP